MAKRKGISPRTRFEVFKRDSFKCQYCGQSAPDVVLHVDHIVPVSKGGDNDMLNLTTSCQKCNGGKSNILLDDKKVIDIRKIEISALRERREQLEMMIEWRNELASLEREEVAAILDVVKSRSGEDWTDEAVATLKKMIKQYGFAKTSDAVVRACDSRSRIGKVTIGYVIGILRNEALKDEHPEIRTINRIRLIACSKSRVSEWVYASMHKDIKAANQAGVSLEELEAMAKEAESGHKFHVRLREIVDPKCKQPGNRR